MDGLSIRKVIDQATSGSIRIPAFQRGFVWDAERVAYLMDSIYKGYPFGALILWRTKEQLQSERQLGPFILPQNDPDYPIDYVLDGQQRLTSIFGVFQSDITPLEAVEWNKVYFDFEASPDLQESQFLALPDEKVDPEKHFPIGTFFNVTAYRKATEHLDAEKLELIDKVQAEFKEATIPVQSIATDNRAKVAIVFERVNRMGVELDTLQLLSAWTWSEEFDLQERFNDLAEDLRPFGFEDVGEDTNLLLRCCAAIIAHDASPSALIGLNGAEVRTRFQEIENGIKGAVDFLRKNLNVQSLNNLPYATLIVALSAFFATPGTTAVKYTEAQRKQLLRWFWRSCFSRRYSAGVLRNMNRDIAEAVGLRTKGRSGIDQITASVDSDYFLSQSFSVGTVSTRTFVLLLAQEMPLSFVSGSPITLANVLQNYNRNEFHHLYPRAYLKQKGVKAENINALVNFAFMSSQDNKTLGGVAPSVYRQKMDVKATPNILEKSLCPASLFEDDFEEFSKERAARLVSTATRLIADQ
ncbi:GmrSD restriction endonuclease domain-containing protein [Streptomyces rubiginosohelvolus]|uniref:GmrSD restriction endonuclease domain-containing protein n=1 Tax=Streptomyces rubiginosohelvolus TaxID=67362 RepID=UPI0033A7CF73